MQPEYGDGLATNREIAVPQHYQRPFSFDPEFGSNGEMILRTLNI